MAFTWDRPRAEALIQAWQRYYPTEIGGPGPEMLGGEFVPGMYLKLGYVITSRGCPNRKCWFCSVPRREGPVRELPIRDGWNVLDDNLLACQDKHIKAVFTMLRRVRGTGRRVEFTGGLEAARLKAWHVDELLTVKPKQMFFAYDTPEDLEPLREAGNMLIDAGWTTASKTLRAYVLCGFPRDTLSAADRRMRETVAAGFTPMAMVYRGSGGSKPLLEWRHFQRQWARPALNPTWEENQ